MFAVMAVFAANAQNYDWKVGNDPVNFPVTAGYTAVTTINGLTVVPKNPMEGTIPNNMGQTEASEKSFDDVDYINRFKFNGAGYSGANADDAVPTVNQPTQRYRKTSFHRNKRLSHRKNNLYRRNNFFCKDL